jgi:competence protein ComEA
MHQRRAASTLLAIGLAAWGVLACAAAPAASAAAERVALVDINSASRAQLKTLPGIGDAEADRIVAGRPYLSKADLASRHVVPTGIYLSLRHRVIAKQERMPPAARK